MRPDLRRSFFPKTIQGIPRCEKCGKEGKINWGDMTYAQQGSWVWEGESLKCKQCYRKEKVEKVMYEKEREFYKKAKEELYPRESPKTRLRQIDSEREWQGTASFYQPWRLPSALEKLIQPLIGDRKPTGAVKVNSSNQSDGNEITERSSSAERRELETFAEGEEEIELVEEESLEGYDERSVKNGARSNTNTASNGTTSNQQTPMVSVRA